MITKEEIQKMSIKEIKAFPESGDAFISLLEEDPRQGVKAYAKTLRRKEAEERRKKLILQEKIDYDNQFKRNDSDLICGIDEVGRGPLAGPVLTAAVIFPKDSFILDINDSKKLSAKKREELAERIKKEAISYSYGIISPQRIDEINILNATKVAMISSVKRLNPLPDLLLIDALKLNTEIPEISIIHGDSLSYHIAAASIIAKVKRDEYMKKMALLYPEYGFEKNMGYGTREHIEAIHKHGLTPIHRRSFCKTLVE